MSRETRALTDEIDVAVDHLDVARLEREYRAQDEFLVIPRFLPPAAVGALLHTRQPGRPPVEVAVAIEPGLMVGVSSSREGERRVVFTMEYVTSREMGRAQRLCSNLKDAFAYFGLRALWRSRGRGARVTA